MSPQLEASLSMLRSVTNRARAQGSGLVAYPVDDVERVVCTLGSAAALAPAVASTPPADLFDQAMTLLKAVIDEPLVTLPGGVEAGWKGPSNLSLHQFRPELSEKIAALLEEAGL